MRICASAALYFLAIFGWGHFTMRVGALASRSSVAHGDEEIAHYLTARLVAGCAALYAIFVALSAAGYLLRTPVLIVLLVGEIGAFMGTRELRIPWRSIQQFSSLERWMSGAVALLISLQLITGLTP